MNATIHDTLTKALASARKEYCDHAESYVREQLDAAVIRLGKAGWDLNVVAPYPNGRMSRFEYKCALAKYSYFTAWFDAVECVTRPGAPIILAPKPNTAAMIKAKAEKLAQVEFDSYVAKLARKIATDCAAAGTEVASTTLVGSLWSGSMLEVELKGGAKQLWSTKCIINCSCLGTLFHQWPTRKVK